jgi:hypothetical protein
LDKGGIAKLSNFVLSHLHTGFGARAVCEGNETDLQPVKSPAPALGRIYGQRKASNGATLSYAGSAYFGL